MNIKVDFNEVVQITPHIEGDDIYSISFVFSNGECCTYGYDNQKNFLKDYTHIMCGNGKEE